MAPEPLPAIVTPALSGEGVTADGRSGGRHPVLGGFDLFPLLVLTGCLLGAVHKQTPPECGSLEVSVSTKLLGGRWWFRTTDPLLVRQ